jgi:hypothetical protein
MVREFTDGDGMEWRAWDVRPDDLDTRMQHEDYLASLYVTGWITFETRSETEKRRLYPIPDGWGDLPERELVRLLERAEVVPQRKSAL